MVFFAPENEIKRLLSCVMEHSEGVEDVIIFLRSLLVLVLANQECYAGHCYDDKQYFYRRCPLVLSGERCAGDVTAHWASGGQVGSGGECDECGLVLGEAEEEAFCRVVRFVGRAKATIERWERLAERGKSVEKSEVVGLLERMEEELDGRGESEKKVLLGCWAGVVRRYFCYQEGHFLVRCPAQGCGKFVVAGGRCGACGTEAERGRLLAFWECWKVLSAPSTLKMGLVEVFACWCRAVELTKKIVFQ